MQSPKIPEVEPQFEKEIDPFQQPSFNNPFQQQVIRCEKSTLSTRRRSSIFEETFTPNPSICSQLLDIISENEHMVKESAHFLLSENQLIRVVAHTFDVPETPEPYNREEIDEMLDKKLNISDQIDVYTKQEDDALLLLKANKTELIDAYSKTEDYELLALKLNITEQIDAYSKTEDDALLDDNLNISDQIDAYSKTQDYALLLLKVDKSELIDAYSKTKDYELLALKLNTSDQIDAISKTEVDALLDDKLIISDQIDAYSKKEDDALLILKVDKTQLDIYVDLTSTQTITGQKQFRIISASNISKQNKNDAQILLIGGGDMLVSSLVSQPQLYEVRDIAPGKSKGYVIATTDEMNTWMEDQENIAKLAIGGNLYIVENQVMDYWRDGTSLRALKTELPDMSNVMTILGAATGGRNAITDLSFSENTLIPAKNNRVLQLSSALGPV
ncbi:MAG: hypothetical protein EZS28_003063 [Streblomastix strix]|uniref:Uncharacterized protein n=1 Tax=Streblomastix strix TaxID=222440 RepID=A0A5J4X2Z0_9EUKA|nr:MAG: hypothetical protein EZS28_003063 [Streblomastix strix]